MVSGSAQPQRPLRIVVFGKSILSDWENPLATSARAILSALAARDHEVTFMERRGNRPLLDLLRARGSAALRSFAARYPDLSYRTYDLPSGWERTVFFGREVGTADAVLALPGTPEPFLAEIDALDSHNLVRLVDESFPATHAEIRLVRATGGGVGAVAFGPAVGRLACMNGAARRGVAVVAYDDGAAALRAQAELAGLAPDLLVVGPADLPGWTYVPEVELPERYCRLESAVIVGIGTDRAFAPARLHLPLGSGCRAIDGADPSRIRRAFDDPAPAPGLPSEFEADRQASALAEATVAVLLAKRPV